jgi:hypothetical protein
MREAQSPRDKILWTLGSGGGKLSISRLRKHTELTKAEPDDILDELEKRG